VAEQEEGGLIMRHEDRIKRTFSDVTDYFKRVRRRKLGGEVIEDGVLTFRGPPTREPSNGRVIVHNQVAHTLTQIPGMHGFRAWTQLKDDDCVVCRCGWGGIKHYRYRGSPTYIYDGGPFGYLGKSKPKTRKVA
jgi:hypothetical protein